MGKTKEIVLSKEQISALYMAYRFGSCHRFRMRCKAVLMKADNKSMKEIQKFVGYGRLAIYRWFKQYRSEGLEGLREKGGRGAKPLMSSTDTEAVKKAVRKHRLSIKTGKAKWEENSKRNVSDTTFRHFLELLAQDINV